MSYTPDFTAVQQVSAPSKLVVTDAGSGTDGAIAARRLFLKTADGTYLVPDGTTTDYILWDVADDLIEPDVLDKDYALYIYVHYVDSGGETLYTADLWKCCDIYTRSGKYDVERWQVSNKKMNSDAPYLTGLTLLNNYRQAAKNAVEIAGDLYTAQAALDAAAELLADKTKFF